MGKKYRYFHVPLKIFLFVLLPALAHCQVLHLADVVDKAVANYPLIQQRQAEIRAAQAHITTVRGNKLPALTLQEQLDLGTNNGLQGGYFSLGLVPSGVGSSSSTPAGAGPNPGNIAIGFLQWEFFNFGYYRAQAQQAGAQLAVNEAALAGDKYLLSENIISLYLDWLKKYRLLQIQRENMQRAQVIFNAIRATVLSGLKPGVDSSTASATYAQARIDYLQAQEDFNSGRITLAAYTGLATDNAVPDTSLTDPARFPAGIPADSVAPGHPLLNVYEKQYEQQLADNNAIAKKYQPRVALEAATWERSTGISYSGKYPESLSDGMPYSKYNYLFGLSLTYNLFDLKHRHDQLAEGGFQAQARQSAFQTQQVNLNRMLQQVNSTLATTREKLRELPVQLSSARQAYGQQTALYRSGLNTLIEVTNAQYELLQAETNYVNTQDALLQLLFLQAGLAGHPDDFIRNFKR
jgi:outer membrane protein TolC